MGSMSCLEWTSEIAQGELVNQFINLEFKYELDEYQEYQPYTCFDASGDPVRA